MAPKDVKINLKANNNTLRCEIECNNKIDYRYENSVGNLLGFKPRILIENEKHVSDSPVKILKINALCIECNITSGAYINGKRVHTIHEFFPSVPPGYKIIEVPSHVIYLPVSVRAIHRLQLSIVDQDSQPVNFRGEEITIRLHVKSL